MYLTTTIPDILYALGALSRFLNCPKESRFKVTNRVLRYVKRTLSYCIKLNQSQDFKLQGYYDSDWGRFLDDIKSSDYCFSFGSKIIF